MCGWTFRVLPQVGISLLVHDLSHEFSVLLIHGDDPSALRVGQPVERDGPGQPAHPHTVERESPQHFNRSYWIVLLLRNEVRIGWLLLILADRIASCLIPIVQQVLTVLGGVVQYGYGSGHHVIHGIAQAPPATFPGARIQCLCPQVTRTRWEVVDGVEVRSGVAVQRGLGPIRSYVLEYRQVIDVSGIPRVERRHVGRTHLALGLQTLRHRHADHIHFA